MKTNLMCRLVKGEDLNHHGTLFAGRAAEWFVEAGFIAAAAATKPENIVCAKVHGMAFARPVKKGTIIRCESKIVQVGRSSMVVYVKILLHEGAEFFVDGFLTFVHVDEQGRPVPHGLVVTAANDEEQVLQERANAL